MKNITMGNQFIFCVYFHSLFLAIARNHCQGQQTYLEDTQNTNILRLHLQQCIGQGDEVRDRSSEGQGAEVHGTSFAVGVYG